ncbi:unnamed protein product, partial [marine sediment metagenome]
YVLETLKAANEGCVSGKYRALVTGPVHKAIIHNAGTPFQGHTQYFAQQTNSQVLMFFVCKTMKVALATTHIPLNQVAKQIDESLITQCITILSQGLSKYFSVDNPTILVTGINPHAGEDGTLGDEEQVMLKPTLDSLRKAGHEIIGPVPADTAFTAKYLQQADAILAMYHDQALPVVKAQGFGEAVNVTLGLPYLRTSVDHGTALDLAGTGQANHSSLKHAVQLALELTS